MSNRFVKCLCALAFLFVSTSVFAAWFLAPVQTVDFSAEELDVLQKEFHSAYDADIAALGGTFKLQFFKSVFSYLSTATVKGDVYQVSIMAGNLSKKTMDMDSLRILICHEIGHFLGGGPRRIELDPEEEQTWNVIEGAADYFAAVQCMKRVLRGQDHSSLLGQVDELVVRRCAESFSQSEERAICQRTMLAGKKLIRFFATAKNLEDTFRFDTPNLSTVARTNPAHPDLQCRLDTYAAGALCNVPPDSTMDPNDLSAGTCSDRPACWFAE